MCYAVDMLWIDTFLLPRDGSLKVLTVAIFVFDVKLKPPSSRVLIIHVYHQTLHVIICSYMILLYLNKKINP